MDGSPALRTTWAATAERADAVMGPRGPRRRLRRGSASRMEAYARGSRIRMRACRALTQLSGASSFGLAKTIVGDSVDDVFPFSVLGRSARSHSVRVSIPNLETASASTCLLFSDRAPAGPVCRIPFSITSRTRSDMLHVQYSLTSTLGAKRDVARATVTRVNPRCWGAHTRHEEWVLAGEIRHPSANQHHQPCASYRKPQPREFSH